MLRSHQHPSPPPLQVLSRLRLCNRSPPDSSVHMGFFSQGDWSGLPFLSLHHNTPSPPQKKMVKLTKKSFKNNCPSRTAGLFVFPLVLSSLPAKMVKREARRRSFHLFQPLLFFLFLPFVLLVLSKILQT